ncbi:innexin inx1-like [Portunus trituberculatus]|uniref:Innexin n=1 Tax=Portunus trituberculatus TaxID=210409 RepID=A0A5B7CY59_PORTR|nr:innexin inx1-like [Portunus trituberculatus]MPC13296.1 Innexin inx1 [Portunus trituberculatus]
MSAIKYLGGLKAYLARGECVNESSIFRLHYQFTVVVLIGASVLLTAAEFFGNPIDCITGLSQGNVINTYCWIHSTFTIQDYYLRESGMIGAQPGVGPPAAYDEEEMEAKWRFHNYYQWVVFFLFFQAALCYAPKFVWNNCEGGLMRTIGDGLNPGLHKEEEVSSRKKVIIDYIVKHIRMHNGYVFKYWFCELLCFINIVGQLFLIDAFLGGEFLTYGPRVVEYSEMDQTERVDPMIFVFPRMTKCYFHKFGPSGTLERHDAFCLLPLNILNEKVFITVWFWYVILAILLGGLLLYRIALFTLPGLRPRAMHKHNKAVPIETVEAITNKTSIGDWWILYVLSTNIDPLIYRDIMVKLSKEIETANSNSPYNNAGLYSSSSV